MSWGAGLRAGQSLVLGAKARALLRGPVPRRRPTTSGRWSIPTLRHRILLGYRAEADGVTVDAVIDRLLEHVKGPLRLMSASRSSPQHPVRRAAPPSDDPARPGGSLIDPQTLMRIKSLQLRARVAVEGFIKGIHRSPYHGFSVEFSEYREYSPGDDPRYPRLAALRPLRPLLRQAVRGRDEPPLLPRASTRAGRWAIGSGAYSKSDYARTAAATIAYFLSTAARRGRPAHVRGPDHRVPAAALSAGPSAPADGDARARAARAGRPTWPSRSSRSPRPSASAG